MVGSKQAGVFLVMSLSISSSVLPIASWGAVLAVAHHLEFIFLPSVDGLFDEDLGDHRLFQTVLDDLLVLLDVVGNSAAGAAQREAGADHERQSDLLENRAGILERVRVPGSREVHADLLHGL